MTVVRRDKNEKLKISLSANYLSDLEEILMEIQKNLFELMKKYREENTRQVSDYAEFKEIMKTKKGLIYAFWCEDPTCEAKIKEETKATTRVLPLDAKEEKGKCVNCGKSARSRWYFAQAY